MYLILLVCPSNLAVWIKHNCPNQKRRQPEVKKVLLLPIQTPLPPNHLFPHFLFISQIIFHRAHRSAATLSLHLFGVSQLKEYLVTLVCIPLIWLGVNEGGAIKSFPSWDRCTFYTALNRHLCRCPLKAAFSERTSRRPKWFKRCKD